MTLGSANGTGAAASFSGPTGVAVDAAGNVYVADTGNNEIRKITPAGVVTTLAGSTNTGASAVAVDAAGNVYVAGNDEVRKITPAGVVTTLAGSATAGSADGMGAAAGFDTPLGLATDAAGNVYVADTGNNEIRKITPAGLVTTLAGSTTAGSVDGTGSAARFNLPWAVAVDSTGNVYVADTNSNEIRDITPAGVVTTLAGSTILNGSTDGLGNAASFSGPSGVALDAEGNGYVADGGEIRKITPGGDGHHARRIDNGSAGVAGRYRRSAARFSNPAGVAVRCSRHCLRRRYRQLTRSARSRPAEW